MGICDGNLPAVYRRFNGGQANRLLADRQAVETQAAELATESNAGAPTVVVGAGPGGLTAAYELSKHGLPAVVYEMDDIVGGISRTAVYEGYRFDIGGHRFFTKVPYVQELWQELLGDELLTRPRLSRIFSNTPSQPP